MKVLVTGANGYLGKGVVRELLNQGHDVVAASRNIEGIDTRAVIKKCDIFELDDPYLFFEQPEVVIHMAWRDGFIHYSDAHMEDLPKHCAFLAKLAASDMKTIAVLGSMHEVGFYEGSIDENTPCRPESYYGIAKNALRGYTKIICKRAMKNFLWLRGYYIVGNTSAGSSIFSKIVAAEGRGEKKFPFTYGQNQFDFIDYDEFCKQTVAAISQSNICGTINICSGRPEKLADRVERFISDNKFGIKLEYGAFPDRPYDSKAVWGNDLKIQSIIKEKK